MISGIFYAPGYGKSIISYIIIIPSKGPFIRVFSRGERMRLSADESPASPSRVHIQMFPHFTEKLGLNLLIIKISMLM